MFGFLLTGKWGEYLVWNEWVGGLGGRIWGGVGVRFWGMRRYSKPWQGSRVAMTELGAEEECVLATAADWMGFEPDEEQAAVIGSEGKNVLLCCSRQWGKSTTAAALVALQAMRNPGRLVLVLSPSLEQTGEFLRKVREMVERAGMLKGGGKRSVRLTNGAMVMGAPENQKLIRGYSAPLLLVVDEAAQVKDTVYEAVRPMLATGKGRIVLLSTPYGQRGFFWKAWMEEGEEWMRVAVPATRCARIGKEFLEREKARMGEELFGQEYLCEFTGATQAGVSAEAMDGMGRWEEEWEESDWE